MELPDFINEWCDACETYTLHYKTSDKDRFSDRIVRCVHHPPDLAAEEQAKSPARRPTCET
tara:strand:- start:65 stop:247 length:183 start_codon:yes stop_codon:yes gene_type:complete